LHQKRGRRKRDQHIGRVMAAEQELLNLGRRAETDARSLRRADS
jgi:hypothetical protein